MYFWDKHKTITTYYELLSGEVCDRYELTQMECKFCSNGTPILKSAVHSF